MASVASFIRNTPVSTLRTYFERTGLGLTPPVDWGAAEPVVVRSLLSAFQEMATEDRTRVLSDIDRVAAIADEPGQVALYGVTQKRAQLDQLRNANDRSLWMFLNDPDAFRHAEEVRFTDERRRGRMWDGFVCPPDLTIHREGAPLEAFKQGVRECLETQNVHTDIFDRQRTAFDGANF